MSTSIRLPKDLEDRLSRFAASTGRTKAFYIRQALEAYLDTQAWQVEETLKAVQEADAGDFATDEDVRAFRDQWS